MAVPPQPASVSGRHTLPCVSPRHEPQHEDFTNVTDLCWPDAVVHPRYAGVRGYRELRGQLGLDLGQLSYETLARISWLVGAATCDTGS